MADFLIKPNWVEDNGDWWYVPPCGRGRERGDARICEQCGIAFPNMRSNPGRFCSPACNNTHRHSNGWRGTSKTRADLFERWRPDECWLAGFIWADGCLTRKGGYLTVSLTSVDEDAIAQAAAIAGCPYSTISRKDAERRTYHRLIFGARDATERLQAIGLAERKSATACWPSPDLPHPAAFLRGVFDGDGAVMTLRTKYLRTALCGGEEFLHQVNAFLEPQGIRPKRVRRNGRSLTNWTMEWSQADSLRLAEIMYADGGPRMARKFEHFAVHAAQAH